MGVGACGVHVSLLNTIILCFVGVATSLGIATYMILDIAHCNEYTSDSTVYTSLCET